MKTNIRLYEAIKSRYSHMTNAAIGRMMGVGPSAISKIGQDVGVGEKAAKFMADHHPDCKELYQEVLQQLRDNKVTGQSKANKTKKRKPMVSFTPQWPVTHPQPETHIE